MNLFLVKNREFIASRPTLQGVFKNCFQEDQIWYKIKSLDLYKEIKIPGMTIININVNIHIIFFKF